MAAAPKLMTTEELLAMPDDGTERWLIRGQLREKPPTLTVRGKGITVKDREQGRTLVRLGASLCDWVDTQPEPRGEVHCGKAGVRLRRTPDTTMGVDIAYIGVEVAARRSDPLNLIDGVPDVVAEILSPRNIVEEMDEKIDEYLAAGVALVWILDPRRRTVTIYRPNAEPELVNVRQELTGEPHLPGFRVAVAKLFS